MAIDTTSLRTRRAILVGALGGAAASVAAAIGRPGHALAGSDVGDPVRVGGYYTSQSTTSFDIEGSAGFALYGRATADTAIIGVTHSGHGVIGQASAAGDGVTGTSASGPGVHGSTGSGDGVYGVSNSRYGVHGNASATTGFNVGVFGETKNPGGVAVLGNNSATTGNAQGVQGTSDSSQGYATTGWARGRGTGVIGVSASTFPYSVIPSHIGVYGYSDKGRGGQFSGTVAQIRLVASTASTHPTSGGLGDLFLDKPGRLWLCKGGTTWVKLG